MTSAAARSAGVSLLAVAAVLACSITARLGARVLVAAEEKWSTARATDWDLVDDALSVAEGSVTALGNRIEYLYEDIYIGLAMVVDQLRLEVRRFQPALESALRAARQLRAQSREAQFSLTKAAAALNRTRELFKLSLDIYQRGAALFLDTLTMESAAALLPIIRLGNWAFDFPPSRVSSDFMKVPRSSEEFLEDFSDFCILELSTPRKPEECRISSKCFDLMTDPYRDGYWLTHELFYALIAYVSPCRQRLQELLRDHREMNIKTFLHQTCSNIYRDAIFESKQGLSELFQDLFIEQVNILKVFRENGSGLNFTVEMMKDGALQFLDLQTVFLASLICTVVVFFSLSLSLLVGFCGLAGFPEFYKPEWIRAIRSWQRADGCFTDSLEIVDDPLTTFKRKPARTKRAEIRLEDRCRPHKTILGAIAMSAGLKYLINSNNLTISA
ncbi:UPF0764 protein C16orf89 homolog [Rhipicephalus sanguineus]|uniref:UPF0764 protein C16orf89 homolog n=1 Tax=Rhipicephalus sanguineus TaxID=34632 RepID=UPI0020C3B80D|nr:UPF0764 protein C16orf89 homolog [Rhipicephalus sanguineus]